ncbi:MAG: hypothetical protein K8I30_19165 [Anaerolineae bacterium]|nr:hypothetical protein [Anaerolineae bacterium]
MDAVEPANNFFYYGLFVAIFDCRVAVFSYAYQLVKSNASIEVQNQFRSTLKAPSKWLLSGREGNTLLEAVLVFGSGCKTQAEYFQKHSIGSIQFHRIGFTVLACLFTLPFFLNIFSVPANTGHLAIPYVVFLVAQLYTLIKSWRFGHELIELSPSGSSAMNRDDT